LGTDSLGRDLLARLGHGALRTVGVTLVVTAVCTLTGLVLGMAARVGAGLTEVVATLPAVLAGLLTTAVTGPSVWGAALAVCLVGWTPYAAQAAALLEQERASGHLLASVSFGAGPGYLLRRHLLPAVLPPILPNALLSLPTTVLVLASLGFLGLGEQPPTAEWGRLLSENQPYVELAPWTVLGPPAHSSCCPFSPYPVRPRDGACFDGRPTDENHAALLNRRWASRAHRPRVALASCGRRR
jgi:ABC-type dipeptide/oligopeptide/nickel transport system permease subunit